MYGTLVRLAAVAATVPLTYERARFPTSTRPTSTTRYRRRWGSTPSWRPPAAARAETRARQIGPHRRIRAARVVSGGRSAAWSDRAAPVTTIPTSLPRPPTSCTTSCVSRAGSPPKSPARPTAADPEAPASGPTLTEDADIVGTTTLALLPNEPIAYTENGWWLCQSRDPRQHRARGSVCIKTATANQYIEITPGVCGGKPRIAGHRITVANIVIWHERLGKSADEIATQCDLTLADVYAALAYYFDNREAIDEYESIAKSRALVASLRKKNVSRLAKRMQEPANQGEDPGIQRGQPVDGHAPLESARQGAGR